MQLNHCYKRRGNQDTASLWRHTNLRIKKVRSQCFIVLLGSLVRVHFSINTSFPQPEQGLLWLGKRCVYGKNGRGGGVRVRASCCSYLTGPSRGVGGTPIYKDARAQRSIPRRWSEPPWLVGSRQFGVPVWQPPHHSPPFRGATTFCHVQWSCPVYGKKWTAAKLEIKSKNICSCRTDCCSPGVSTKDRVLHNPDTGQEPGAWSTSFTPGSP